MSEPTTRLELEAAALRANLARRKQQQRARQAAGDAQPDAAAPATPPGEADPRVASGRG